MEKSKAKYPFVAAILDIFKYFFNGPGDDTSLGVRAIIFEALHGVCFSRAGLSIGNDGRIESFER